MPYLGMDDGYPDHPKVEALSDSAFRLHVSAMAYAAKYMLDGYLAPVQITKRSGYRAKALVELLDAVLIHDIGDGCDSKTCQPGRPGMYLLHDYLQWNRSREQIEAMREAKRKAGQKGAQAKWQQ